LSAEEELEIAVAQGTQGCGPFRRGRGFRAPFYSRGRIFLLSHSSRSFSHLGDNGNRRGKRGMIESAVGAIGELLPQMLKKLDDPSRLVGSARREVKAKVKMTVLIFAFLIFDFFSLRFELNA
jgi:hypothetical protein